MIGQNFGRLTVVQLDHKDVKYRKFWKCRCACGKETVVQQYSLTSGATTSCGCYRSEMTKLRSEKADSENRKYTYGSYQNMVKRCYKPYHAKYYMYGAVGITVCDRWLNGEDGRSGWECFFHDMGPRPKGYSIDRVDGSKGYAPDNCRWATAETQNRNRAFKK